MKLTILAGLAILWPAVSCAADDFKPLDAKPGLWESITSIEFSGASARPLMPQIPEEALAKMTPVQRAQIEAMSKGRGGAGAPTTTRVCVTQESLNAGAFGRRDKACTNKVVSSSLSKQVIHVECSMGEIQSTGDMTIERVDPQHLKGTMVMKSSKGDQAKEVKMSFENKWIAADCGEVKPAGAK